MPGIFQNTKLTCLINRTKLDHKKKMKPFHIFFEIIVTLAYSRNSENEILGVFNKAEIILSIITFRNRKNTPILFGINRIANARLRLTLSDTKFLN